MTEFVDDLPPKPPRKIGQQKKFVDFVDDLLSNPGRWAKYPTKLYSVDSAQSTARKIRNGRNINFQCGKFDAQERDGVVYVRAV